MKFTTKVVKVMAGESPPSTSPALKVDTTDMAKVIRTGLLMGAATLVTYVLNNVQPEMFGDYSAVAAIVITMLSELALRYIKNNTKEVEQ